MPLPRNLAPEERKNAICRGCRRPPENGEGHLPPPRAAAQPMQPGLLVGDEVMPTTGQDFLGRPNTGPTKREVHCKPCD